MLFCSGYPPPNHYTLVLSTYERNFFLKKKIDADLYKRIFFFALISLLNMCFSVKKKWFSQYVSFFSLLFLLVLFVQMIGSWLNCGKAYDNTFCSFELLKQRLNEKKNQWKKMNILNLCQTILFVLLSVSP